MLLDTQNLFSDNQKITTGTIVSDNVVAFGKGDVSFMPVIIQATEDFSNLTSLKVAVETCDDVDFSSKVVLAESSMPKASLVKGAKFPIAYLPKKNKGYMRLVYTVSGTQETTGKITASVVCGDDLTWQEL